MHGSSTRAAASRGTSADEDGEDGEEGEEGESAEEREHDRHNAAGEAGEESAELHSAFAHFQDARGLGLLKDPGAYTDAYAHLAGIPTAPASWQEVTKAPYNSDAPAYRDPVSSNSGGGAGFVTGRIVGLAVDPAKHGLPYQPVYAAGAQGGVFRSLDNGASWTPISDKILTLATGDLRIAPDGSLWYGTGEPNYGNALGCGVYRLAQAWKPGAVSRPRIASAARSSRPTGSASLPSTAPTPTPPPHGVSTGDHCPTTRLGGRTSPRPCSRRRR